MMRFVVMAAVPMVMMGLAMTLGDGPFGILPHRIHLVIQALD